MYEKDFDLMDEKNIFLLMIVLFILFPEEVNKITEKIENQKENKEEP